MKNSRILVLTGSGEFTKAMENTDSYLLKLAAENINSNSVKKIKVAIIPTAAGKENDYRKWIEMGKAHFSKLGANATGFEIINKKDANSEKYADEIKDFQLIYFSGGDPGYLFDTLKGSIFWENVFSQFKKGTILAGSSAGAMILGNFVIANVYRTFENGVSPDWVRAFNFVPFAIIPHFDHITDKMKTKYSEMMARSPDHIKENMMGIDEDTSLILDFNKKKALVSGRGNVTIIRNGKEQNFNSNSGINPDYLWI